MLTNLPDACFAGVVPSLPRSVLVLLPRHGFAPKAVHLCAIQTPVTSHLRRIIQQREVANMIIGAIYATGTPVVVAVLGHNPKGCIQHHTVLIELGAVLRHRLYTQDWPLVEAAPTLVAKFTGRLKEQAPPAELVNELQRFQTLNTTTAYMLAHMARCLMQPDDYAAAQAEMLAIMRTRVFDPRADKQPAVFPRLRAAAKP